MKLTYRGNFYEVSDPVDFDFNSQDLPRIKLIYRGNTYYYTPQPAVSEEMEADVPTVTLKYRGNTYKRKIQSQKLDADLLTLDWRWDFE